MGGDTIEEPAIVRDHHHAAAEFHQRIFQRAQGFHVQIIGGFIEQQHIAALQQRLRHMQAAALAA